MSNKKENKDNKKTYFYMRTTTSYKRELRKRASRFNMDMSGYVRHLIAKDKEQYYES
jgi:hypothetical protein